MRYSALEILPRHLKAKDGYVGGPELLGRMVNAGWENVSRVEVDAISIDGPQKLEDIPVNNGAITLDLTAGQGVSIRPAG